MGKKYVANAFHNRSLIDSNKGGGGDASVDIVAEETKVGTFMGKDLYRRVFVADTMILQAGEVGLFQFDARELYIVDFKGVFKGDTQVGMIKNGHVYTLPGPNAVQLTSGTRSLLFDITTTPVGLGAINNTGSALTINNLVIYVYYTKENPFQSDDDDEFDFGFMD